MHLVLFDQAVLHVLRLCRLLRRPGGHCLLVGVGGSGKQSMAKLAAFVCGYPCESPKAASPSALADFNYEVRGGRVRAHSDTPPHTHTCTHSHPFPPTILSSSPFPPSHLPSRVSRACTDVCARVPASILRLPLGVLLCVQCPPPQQLVELFKRAAVKPGLPLVLLIGDSHLRDERLLVPVSDFLSSGVVLGAMPPDEVEVAVAGVRAEAKAAGVADTRDALVRSCCFQDAPSSADAPYPDDALLPPLLILLPQLMLLPLLPALLLCCFCSPIPFIPSHFIFPHALHLPLLLPQCAYFTAKVLRNLHVVLALSPVGSALRDRAQRFPALLNACGLDWYHPWPVDALVSVATSCVEVRRPGAQSPAVVACSCRVSQVLLLHTASRPLWVLPV
jgi:hypothetical protein